ncbi:hypothetical protein LMG29739_05375 [Paraburkholderia solisilvae]|uniref:Uncharacterized protein n=1 Tax=Paraburkholderia solisilvae TaxID=624376 RepID=A0A6J5EUT6_9BURK|nr:hypothetical protein LMG29739_05375 [Paraburkholderia solisilvae]
MVATLPILVTPTLLTVPSSRLKATTFVVLYESCHRFAPDAISFALLPVVALCVDAAELVSVLLPPAAVWSHDESLLLHGFAIA